MTELKCCPFCQNAPMPRKTPWYSLLEDLSVQILCKCGASGPLHIYDGISSYESALDYAAQEWNQLVNDK